MKLVLRGSYDDNNKNTLKSDYTRPWCVCARARERSFTLILVAKDEDVEMIMK